MRIVPSAMLLLIFFTGCSKYQAKYLSSDFKKPEKIAVLPISNQTVDVEGSRIFRHLLQKMMNRTNYVKFLPLAEVDRLLNEEGITDGGQLSTIDHQELFRLLRVDGLLYNDLLECQIFSLKHVNEQAVKANLRLVVPPARKIWEVEKAEYGEAFLGGLGRRIKYATQGIDDHPLISQMEDVIIKSLRTLPGYIDRDFPATIFGLDAAYFQPTGSWNKHPYAADAQLFNSGTSLFLEIESKSVAWGIALGFNYTLLSLADWEDYLEEQRQKTDATAYLYHIDLIVKYYPWISRNHIFKLEFGIHYLNGGGKETYNGEMFDYSFLTWGMGPIAGGEYDLFVSDYMVLSLRSRYLLSVDVIDFGDKKYNLAGFYFAGGLKIYY